MKIIFIEIFEMLLLINIVSSNWLSGIKEKYDPTAGERCFCQLKGKIDDCSCSIETIDSFNNLKIYPRLHSILLKDYFRYWKVNLNKGCPFWEDDSRCAMRYCSVETCKEVPKELEIHNIPHHSVMSSLLESDCDEEGNLGYLNTTISDSSRADFEKWAAHDLAQEDSFCYLDDESSNDNQYVDLSLNPERFTGYAGPSAHRVWKSIYQENCFKPSKSVVPEFGNIGDMCFEKRVFFRAISGLHSSINIHLSAQYLQSDREGFMESPHGIWGANVEEFKKRFDPELTGGHGPHRLKNLYFLYLLELRALEKIAPYWESFYYFTGNEETDQEMRMAIKDLLKVVKSFPDHFDETTMFTGGIPSLKLKKEFKDHFKNISRIMDCVGCDKCRLWGKLQVTGLGTALKILFSGKFDKPLSKELTLDEIRLINFHLTRNEIVALFNAFGRLSTSISEIENFRRLLDT